MQIQDYSQYFSSNQTSEINNSDPNPKAIPSLSEILTAGAIFVLPLLFLIALSAK